MHRTRWLPFALLLSPVLGCLVEAPQDASSGPETDTSDSTSPCVPGQSIPCTCTGADVGVQVCRSDGSGYEPCACEMADDTTTTTGTTAGTDTGSTGEATDTSATGETTDTSATGEATDTSATGEATDTSATGETTDTGGSCGDGAIDPGEDCDDGGESAVCDGDCTLVECGDSILNATAGELCDGDDLAGVTCQSQGFTAGVLACAPDCAAHDTSGCADPPGAPVLGLGFSAVKQFDFSWAAVADADHYQLEESAAPGEPFVPLGGDIVGTSISHTMPLHLRHQASYRLRACNVAGCTDSAVVDVASSLAEAVGYIKASNTDVDDELGSSVSLSADGSTLVIGAPQEESAATGIDGDQADDSAGGSGAAYVLVRDATGAWSQQAYIKASNTDANDLFGASTALSDDGNTLAVGAFFEDSSATGIDGDQADDSTEQSGAVYVFVRDDMGTWSQQAYVKASNTGAWDWFVRLALSGDGNTLAVGAQEEDSSATGIDGDQASDAAPQSGAVYVFARSGMGTWSQQAYIKASNAEAGDQFGSSVALSGNGNTLAVGAWHEDGSATGIGGDQASNAAPQSGAVYVLVRDAMGTWSQQAYVKASNTDAGDYFGARVVLSADGNTLAVGAIVEDSDATGIGGDQADDTLDSSGAVYVLVRDAMGTWSQQAYVKASNNDTDDGFGYSGDSFGYRLAMSADGNVLAVGAYTEDGNATGIGGEETNELADAAGAVYVLVRDDMGAWSQRAYVKASNTDEDDQFAFGLSLSGDADTLAVGARFEDGSATGIGGDQASDLASNSGAVYLY